MSRRVLITSGAGFLGSRLAEILGDEGLLPLPQNDSCQHQPDITKAHKEFRWKPKKGLDRTLAHLRMMPAAWP